MTSSPYKLLIGDNRELLRKLPTGLVQCAITSPPYYKQRDYGTGMWEGGDADCDHRRKHGNKQGNPEFCHPRDLEIASADDFFPDVCGKCGAVKGADLQSGREETPEEYIANQVVTCRELRRVLRDDGTFWYNIGEKYENKQMLAMPWRVALALQADGWLLRSDIIWKKPNAMPSSQRDRPSCNHEYIFLFTKGPKYYYDDVAIREPSTSDDEGMRTKRSVWTVPVAREKAAHFAVFPPDLIEPCVLAGTSEKGCCPKCHAPIVRQTEEDRVATRPGRDTKLKLSENKHREANGMQSAKSTPASVAGNRDPERHITHIRTVGWAPSCSCDAGDPIPCVVLDIHAGSGTTLAVAVNHHRRAIGLELNPDNVPIIHDKVSRAKYTAGFKL